MSNVFPVLLPALHNIAVSYFKKKTLQELAARAPHKQES